MKVGVIRCQHTETLCPASNCIKAINNKQDAFLGIEEEVSLLGVNTCGGCPGKSAVLRAANMVSRGADAIALSSCVSTPSPVGIPCPHAAIMKEAIEKRVGPGVRVFDYTHK